MFVPRIEILFKRAPALHVNRPRDHDPCVNGQEQVAALAADTTPPIVRLFIGKQHALIFGIRTIQH